YLHILYCFIFPSSLSSFSLLLLLHIVSVTFSFFFNATASTDIYTLSLHDALPIFSASVLMAAGTAGTVVELAVYVNGSIRNSLADRKSTRLNSSHVSISYAVFCLKKKKNIHAIS